MAPSKLIDARIKDLGDWRGKTLSRVRALIKQADPEIVEDVKWRKPSNPRGVPVWCHDGIVCTGEIYKDKVKLTFAKGASLEDPTGLFNASLEGNTRRAIDLHEGNAIDEVAFKSLVRDAAALNASSRRKPSKTKLKDAACKGKRSTATKKKGTSAVARPKLLSGDGWPSASRKRKEDPLPATRQRSEMRPQERRRLLVRRRPVS